MGIFENVKPAFKKHGDKLLFALAIAVLVIALFTFIWEEAMPRASAPVLIFTQWWQRDLEDDTLETLIKEFESLHSGITVFINNISYEDLRQRLFYPKEGQFPIDILALDPLWAPELIKNGTIETIEEQSQPKQRVDPPLLSFISLLYYNVEILKEAGFTRPPKTRTEFIAHVRGLTNNQDSRWGLVVDQNSSRGIYDDVFPWIWASGEHFIKDGKPAFTSRPLIESLTFLSSLKEEERFILESENKLEDFISGKAAFMIASADDIARIRERMDEEAFGITTVPTPDNFTGKIISASAAWAIAVHANSAYKEEARLFADFLASNAALLSKSANAVPGNSATPPPPDVFYSKAWDIASTVEFANDFSGLPWMEMQRAFKEELNILFEAEASPSEAATSVQKKWEAILEDFSRE